MIALIRRFFRGPESSLSGMKTSTPEQIASTDFLTAFAKSEDEEIEVSAERIAAGSIDYAGLSGIDYLKIRNRFRVLSNLDPVVNSTEEVGVIRFSYLSDDSMKDVLLEARFLANSDRFYLKKK